MGQSLLERNCHELSARGPDFEDGSMAIDRKRPNRAGCDQRPQRTTESDRGRPKGTPMEGDRPKAPGGNPGERRKAAEGHRR